MLPLIVQRRGRRPDAPRAVVAAAFCAAALLASGALAGCRAARRRRHPISAVAPAPRAAPAWTRTANVRAPATPLVRVGTDADGAELYALGGRRAAVHGGGAVEWGAGRFAAPIAAATRVRSGWVFVARDGTVARSAGGFAGPLTPLGVFAQPGATALAGSVGRAVILVDGALWTTDGDAPPARATPRADPSRRVVSAVFRTARRGLVLFDDGALGVTDDGGATVAPLASPCEPGAPVWDVTLSEERGGGGHDPSLLALCADGTAAALEPPSPGAPAGAEPGWVAHEPPAFAAAAARAPDAPAAGALPEPVRHALLASLLAREGPLLGDADARALLGLDPDAPALVRDGARLAAARGRAVTVVDGGAVAAGAAVWPARALPADDCAPLGFTAAGALLAECGGEGPFALYARRGPGAEFEPLYRTRFRTAGPTVYAPDARALAFAGRCAAPPAPDDPDAPRRVCAVALADARPDAAVTREVVLDGELVELVAVRRGRLLARARVRGLSQVREVDLATGAVTARPWRTDAAPAGAQVDRAAWAPDGTLYGWAAGGGAFFLAPPRVAPPAARASDAGAADGAWSPPPLVTRAMPAGAVAVAFADARRGVAAGDLLSALWLTTDGGASWQPVRAPAGVAPDAVQLGDALHRSHAACDALGCTVGGAVRVAGWDPTLASAPPVLDPSSAPALDRDAPIALRAAPPVRTTRCACTAAADAPAPAPTPRVAPSALLPLAGLARRAGAPARATCVLPRADNPALVLAEAALPAQGVGDAGAPRAAMLIELDAARTTAARLRWFGPPAPDFVALARRGDASGYAVTRADDARAGRAWFHALEPDGAAAPLALEIAATPLRPCATAAVGRGDTELAASRVPPGTALAFEGVSVAGATLCYRLRVRAGVACVQAVETLASSGAGAESGSRAGAFLALAADGAGGLAGVAREPAAPDGAARPVRCRCEPAE